MNEHYWDRMARLFEQVMELPEEDRLPFLEKQCEENPEMLEALQGLISIYPDAVVFFRANSLSTFWGKKPDQD